MTRYVAFLRGVNLGKRQTKSADLKAVFESLGFAGVKTLIASGNVLFETGASKGLKAKIEKALEEHFGFEIGVVLRSLDELKAMIASKPFAKADPKADVDLHVLLFAEPMKTEAEARRRRGRLRGRARIDDRRDLLHRPTRSPTAPISAAARSATSTSRCQKGQLVTMRNWNTIEKAAAL